jgi:hypothetical protein
VKTAKRQIELPRHEIFLLKLYSGTAKHFDHLKIESASFLQQVAQILPSAVATSATESDQVRMRTGCGDKNSWTLAELKRRFQFILDLYVYDQNTPQSKISAPIVCCFN